MRVFKDKDYNWYLPLKYSHIIEWFARCRHNCKINKEKSGE